MAERIDDRTLADAFWGVARQLRRHSRDTLARWELAPSHARALGTIARHGTMRLSELSEHLHIAPRSTTEVVDALEERGLVERQPDPQDRRATLVALTAAGTQIDAAIRAARDEGAESLFATLTDSERDRLARILQKLQE